jgi:hypothetical protein
MFQTILRWPLGQETPARLRFRVPNLSVAQA